MSLEAQESAPGAEETVAGAHVADPVENTLDSEPETKQAESDVSADASDAGPTPGETLAQSEHEASTERLDDAVRSLLEAYQWLFLRHTPVYVDEIMPGVNYLRFETNDKNQLFEMFGLEPNTQLTPNTWIAENEECFAVEKLYVDPNGAIDASTNRYEANAMQAIVIDLPKKTFYENMPRRLAEDCFACLREHRLFDPNKQVWNNEESMSQKEFKRLLKQETKKMENILERPLTKNEKRRVKNNLKGK